MTNEEVTQRFITKQLRGNKSSTYILPMLGNYVEEFKHDYTPQNKFISLFLGHTDHEDETLRDNVIMLLYKFDGKRSYLTFEDKLKRHINFRTMYDPDFSHVMYVFNVPEQWKEDYIKFKNWQPSKFSKEYKKQIVSFYNLNDDHPVVQTLNKSEKRFKQLETEFKITIPRELEASSSPYWEIEYYNDSFKSKKLLSPNMAFNTEEDND